MEKKEKIHHIFLTNPVDLLNFVGRFVKIVLENKEILYGTVFTIDPVSQSLILVIKEVSKELSLKIILKHSVTSMEIVPDVPIDQQSILSHNFFKANQSSLPDSKSKEEVKSWLEKNMIPVVEKGDKLVIDSLEIHPPYGVDQCYCSNSIVLSRIQKLLKQMPFKNS